MRLSRLCTAALAAAALLAPLAPTLSAQTQQRSGWATRMLDYKHRLITDKLGMTKAQEQRFMPLYEAMEREIYKVNSDARALARKVYAQAAEALSKARLMEGQIEARYFDKFAQILSKKQLFLLKQAELSFTRSMLSRGKNAVKKSR